MATTVRRPLCEIQVDGFVVPYVLSYNISLGFEQESGTAQFSIPYPAPSYISKYSKVSIKSGITKLRHRFSGWIKDPGAQLWPGTITFSCGDHLWLGEDYYPTEEISLANMTDIEIIKLILDKVGIPYDSADILGSGKIIGEEFHDTITWPLTEPALALIQEIDRMSQETLEDGTVIAYRTHANSAGRVVRTRIDTRISTTTAYTFVEGLNILEGTLEQEKKDPKTVVQTQGNGVSSTIIGSADGSTTVAWKNSAYYQRLLMLQNQASSMGFASTEEATRWILQQLNKNITKVSFSTYEEMRLDHLMSIWCAAPHLLTNGPMWLQGMSISSSEDGAFTQQLQLVSELSQVANPIGYTGVYTSIPTSIATGYKPQRPPQNPKTPSDSLSAWPSAVHSGSGISHPPGGATADDLIPDMTILTIDQEKVLISGVPTNVYIVGALDTSVSRKGVITNRVWSAAGPGVGPASGGNLENFTTYFTSLTGASITITVTDSNGFTKARTVNLEGAPGTIIRSRSIFAMTTDHWEAFDGDTWRTYTPSNAADMDALAPGPMASAGDLLLQTTDLLRTSAIERQPRAGVDITAVWEEPDISEQNLVIGYADGKIATSATAGLSWTVKDGPVASAPVRRIILSRFTPGQIQVIVGGGTPGYYVSDNYGDAWRKIRDGDFVWLELSNFRNTVVTAAGGLERAEDGTPFTFPGSPTIKAAMPHILEDLWYAVADDGTTYGQDVEGGYAMVAREPLPLGTGQVGGLHRDGTIPELFYIAAGDGGLYKTVDGFRTAIGYLKIREGIL